MSLQLYTNFSSSVQLLNYQFLLMSNAYANNNQIALYSASIVFNHNISLTSIGSANMAMATPVAEPLASTIFVTIFGLDVSTTSTMNILDIAITASLVNATVVNFRLSSGSTTSTYVTYIHCNFIVYNTAYFNNPLFAGFNLLTVAGSSQFNYTNASNVYDYTSFVGLS